VAFWLTKNSPAAAGLLVRLLGRCRFVRLWCNRPAKDLLGLFGAVVEADIVFADGFEEGCLPAGTFDDEVRDGRFVRFGAVVNNGRGAGDLTTAEKKNHDAENNFIHFSLLFVLNGYGVAVGFVSG